VFRQDMNADKRDFGGMDGFFPEYPRSSVAKSLAAIEQSDLVSSVQPRGLVKGEARRIVHSASIGEENYPNHEHFGETANIASRELRGQPVKSESAAIMAFHRRYLRPFLSFGERQA